MVSLKNKLLAELGVSTSTAKLYGYGDLLGIAAGNIQRDVANIELTTIKHAPDTPSVPETDDALLMKFNELKDL